MRILSAAEQQQWDEYTIAHEPISSINLMERASERWIEKARPFLNRVPIWILTGTGNNGGDGLAIARMLFKEGYDVQVLLFRFGHQLSKDCEYNLKRLPKSVKLVEIDELESFIRFEAPPKNTLLIDAIFGTGLKSALRSPFDAVIQTINRWNLKTLAVDLPSGLGADALITPNDAMLRVNGTITFQTPKLNLLLPEYSPIYGKWGIVDIGLHQSFLETIKGKYHFLTPTHIRKLLPNRPSNSHKGHFGHLLVMAGAAETMGASILASKAGLVAGSGWVSLVVDDLEEWRGVNQAHPSLMVSDFSTLDVLSEKHRICVGPGLGQSTESVKKLEMILQATDSPLVIDADGLNLLASDQSLLTKVPPHSILTPHPGELAKLIGDFETSLHQLKAAVEFAMYHKVVLLIKRAHTVVIAPDRTVYFNATGNAGMAKAGSGDVLSGMIASLLAQGLAPFDAACAGVYLHGLAADLAIEETSEFGLTPETLIDFIRAAMLNVSTV